MPRRKGASHSGCQDCQAAMTEFLGLYARGKYEELHVLKHKQCNETEVVTPVITGTVELKSGSIVVVDVTNVVSFGKVDVVSIAAGCRS